jgi:putative addiction module component (TIGR02574 family)
MGKKITIGDILELSIAERILLAQDIWDSVAAVPQSLDLSDEEKSELDARIENYRKDPMSSILWDQLKVELLAS